MDLTERAPNGRLDPFAACMLLWSGALSFDADGVVWDGQDHVGTPLIHDDVISLYGISHGEVVAVLPDLNALLEGLARDEQMRVDPEHVAGAVADVVPGGHVSGATLFLLQQDKHPLVVELADKTTVRVRYDEALARGVPNLQELLCRLACHLRAFRGDFGSFAVEFVPIDHARIPSAIGRFDGCVEGGTTRLGPSVAIEGAEKFREFQRAANLVDASEATRLRTAAQLEASLYATRALADATRARIEALEQKHTRLEESKPDAHVMSRTSARSTPRGMFGEAKAMRSMAIRTVVYLAIGGGLMWAGRMCLTQGDQVAAYVLRAWNQALATATDLIELATGQAGLVGSVEAPTALVEPVVEALKVVGYVLMTLGIVFPVWRIIRHKRRLDRHLAQTQSHRAFLSALTEKRQLHMEAAYAQDLDAWAQSLKHNEEETLAARDSLDMLEETEKRVRSSLDECYAALPDIPAHLRNLSAVCTLADYVDAGKAPSIGGDDGAVALYANDLQMSRVSASPEQAMDVQPSLHAAFRSTNALVRLVRQQRDEDTRRKLIREHCDKAAALRA